MHIVPSINDTSGVVCDRQSLPPPVLEFDGHNKGTFVGALAGFERGIICNVVVLCMTCGLFKPPILMVCGWTTGVLLPHILFSVSNCFKVRNDRVNRDVAWLLPPFSPLHRSIGCCTFFLISISIVLFSA